MKSRQVASILRVLLFLPILMWVGGAQADYSSTTYELKTGRKTKLATSTVQFQGPAGQETQSLTTLRGPDGQVLFTEKVDFEGSEIRRVELDQKQTGTTGLVEVRDGKIFFTKTAEGKSTTKEEDKPEKFVMSGNFQKFFRAHWDELKSGKTVEFRFGAWERQETVGFKVFKEAEEDFEGQKVIRLKMKPSSFIIAALVNPLIFRFVADGSKLLAYEGRVPLKLKSGSSWKDQDAEVVYAY